MLDCIMVQGEEEPASKQAKSEGMTEVSDGADIAGIHPLNLPMLPSTQHSPIGDFQLLLACMNA